MGSLGVRFSVVAPSILLLPEQDLVHGSATNARREAVWFLSPLRYTSARDYLAGGQAHRTRRMHLIDSPQLRSDPTATRDRRYPLSWSCYRLHHQARPADLHHRCWIALWGQSVALL